jgi:hypothetical protein
MEYLYRTPDRSFVEGCHWAKSKVWFGFSIELTILRDIAVET